MAFCRGTVLQLSNWGISLLIGKKIATSLKVKEMTIVKI